MTEWVFCLIHILTYQATYLGRCLLNAYYFQGSVVGIHILFNKPKYLFKNHPGRGKRKISVGFPRSFFLGAQVTLLLNHSPQRAQRNQDCLSYLLHLFMDSSPPLNRKKIISQSKRSHWYSWDKRFVTEQQHPANVNFIHSFQKVKQCCFALLCPESKWRQEAQPWRQAGQSPYTESSPSNKVLLSA